MNFSGPTAREPVSGLAVNAINHIWSRPWQANLPPTATDASQKNAALSVAVAIAGKSRSGTGAVSFAGSTKSVSRSTSRYRRIIQWRTPTHGFCTRRCPPSAKTRGCAGWLSGNEYALWEILHGDRHEYGWGDVRYEDLEELRILSEHARGWIWTGPDKEYTPQLVTFAEWESIRTDWRKTHPEGVSLGLFDSVDSTGGAE